MKLHRLLPLVAIPLLFADYLGITPRPVSSEYAGQTDSPSLSIGAEVAASSQVRKVFERDWTSHYLFLEVALYPSAGALLTVAPRDFMLRAGADGESLSPLEAEAILPQPAMKGAPQTRSSSSNVEVAETIGYSSGPYRRGVYTDTEVGVSTGGPVSRPPVTTADKDFELRRALLDYELPDAKTSKPIAGYLYFPKPKSMKKGDVYELKYYGGAERVTVRVPQAKRR